MITASYARYSSNQQRETSIDDQERNTDTIAKQHRLTVSLRYRDKAASGSDPTRPDYQRMMSDAKSGKFRALLIDDLSRLGRDTVEREGSIRRLEFWDIRLITYDGYDSTAPAASRRIIRSGRNITDEMYLVDLAAKTHRGLYGQAAKGNNAGGRTYGYRHVPEYHPSKTDHLDRPLVTAVRREVDPDQAEVVRTIYSHYASGRSPLWIARELNSQGIPSPRGKLWSRTSLYPDKRSGIGILNNPLYAGQYTWNRSRWEKNPDNHNRRTRRERPRSEWITTYLPELRVIDEDLWQSVQRRIQACRNESIARAKAGKGTGGRRPKYLFSGLLKCGTCGGNMTMVNAKKYGCTTHKEKGATACTNGILVSREIVESHLLATIKHDLLSEEAAKYFEEEVRRMQADLQRQQPKDQMQSRLTELETQIDNMVKAIAAGAYSQALQTALEKAEDDKEQLLKHLATLKSRNSTPDIVSYTLRYRQLVKQMEEHKLDIVEAQQALKGLLGEKIPLHPANGGHLEAEISASYEGVLRLAADAMPAVGNNGSGGRI